MRTGPKIEMPFFDRPTNDVARLLIGASLYFESDGGTAGGTIVETEAYDQGDPASHTEYKTRKMNRSMYLSAGHTYIYPRSLFCSLNLVCGPKDYGSAVLIRALQPFEGCKALMRERRKTQRPAAAKNDYLLCNGPMNLCQALGITHDFDGKALPDTPISVYSQIERPEVLCGPRIGVKDSLPRRYILAGSRYVSHLNEKKYPLSVTSD